MLRRLRQRKEWMFFAALPKADRGLAVAWWTVVLLRGVLPALFAIAMGAMVAAVQQETRFAGPLLVVGVAFVLLQLLAPIHTAISHNLGDRTAAYLYDRLTAACVRPQGMGHLEDPALAADLTVARDFDLGMTGPPLLYSMDFIAGGLVGMVGGLAAAVVLFGTRGGRLSFSLAHGSSRTGCCARARSGATVTPTRSGARSATRTTPIASPLTRRRARSCGSSAWSTGRLIGSSRAAPVCISCSTRQRASASGRSRGVF